MMSETTVQTVDNWSFTVPGIAGEGSKWGHAPGGASTHVIQPLKNQNI